MLVRGQASEGSFADTDVAITDWHPLADTLQRIPERWIDTLPISRAYPVVSALEEQQGRQTFDSLLAQRAKQQRPAALEWTGYL